MRKKCNLILILVIVLLICCACGRSSQFPQVTIRYPGPATGDIYLPLRDGYDFAEDAYSIVETEEGYDVVVHCIKQK